MKHRPSGNPSPRQACNQLGTQGGVKSFPRRAQIFWTVSNILILCPTHSSRGAKNFVGVLRLGPVPRYAALVQYDSKAGVQNGSCIHAARPKTWSARTFFTFYTLSIRMLYDNAYIYALQNISSLYSTNIHINFFHPFSKVVQQCAGSNA